MDIQAPIIYNTTKQNKAVCIFHAIYRSINVWHTVSMVSYADAIWVIAA